jgi:hypothetical protein
VASIAGLNIKKSLLELGEVMLLSFLKMEIWKLQPSGSKIKTSKLRTNLYSSQKIYH